MKEVTEQERKEYVKIAKQLFYPDTVIMKLYEAKSVVECEKIMSNARREAR